MTKIEQAQLRDLLGKLLIWSHKGDHQAVFKSSWKLLYALGAKVTVEGQDIFIINPK